MDGVRISDSLFNELVVKNYDYIKYSLRKFVKDDDIIDDLRNDIVYRALRKKHLFHSYDNDPHKSFKKWLYTMIRNEFYNYYKKMSKDRDVLCDIDDHLNIGYEVEYNNQRLNAILNEIEKRYDSKRRIMFQLKLMKYQDEEIGALLDMPSGTVKSNLHTLRRHFIRKRLRKVA